MNRFSLRTPAALQSRPARGPDGNRIVPTLRALLTEQRAKRQSDCPLVCFRLDRKGHAVRIRGFRKSWYSACVRVGLGTMRQVVDEAGKPVFEKPRGSRSKPKQKVKYAGPIFHDLRR